MQFLEIMPPQEPSGDTQRELRLLIEPEPWLRIFLRNLGDLLRKAPPPVWTTARPAQYWEDALVHRPVPWAKIRQSFLGHTLVLLIVLWINLWWLEHPRLVHEEIPQTTITHYQLSEYLPAITPAREKPAPPVRKQSQRPDPEYAAQEIISLHIEHSSKQQTIVQPSPNLIPQDVPLPNLIVSSAIPGAPVVSGRQVQNLPLDVPPAVPPPSQIANRSQITFPVSPLPEVIPPASSVASEHNLAELPAERPNVVPPSPSIATAHRTPALPLTGPIVVAPSQSIALHHPQQLSLPAQTPDIAPPPTSIAANHSIAQALRNDAPQVIPPAQAAARRHLARGLPNLAPQVVPPAQLPASRNVPEAIADAAPQLVPPSPPVAAGMNRPQEQAIGQLLALNARPAPPAPTLTVPVGNRSGEFAAGPNGKTAASARPETVAGDMVSDPSHTSGNTSASLFVGVPPTKITSDAVVAAPPTSPVSHASIPDIPSTDRIDNQIFGARRRYSIRLSMPNLNSAGGSWTMRFAKLNSKPGPEEEISTPEAVVKVDPVYPASMIRDRVEGTVILYAIIRSDGSVASVRILEGFDSRLDDNARTALEQWRFRPGTRNGVPIDVEAVVRVPFRVPKSTF
jgi:TonB family protein